VRDSCQCVSSGYAWGSIQLLCEQAQTVTCTAATAASEAPTPVSTPGVLVTAGMYTGAGCGLLLAMRVFHGIQVCYDMRSACGVAIV
jgi:hypothetical protein